MQTLISKFRQIKFDPKVDNAIKIPDQSGNYILCLRENSFLPKCNIKIVTSKFDSLEVIYTGISSKSLRTRDYKHHFIGNNAGRSTLRKSLGVLFGYKQIPRDKDPNTGKSKFKEPDEVSLSKWMKENLILYVFPTTNYDEIEIQLIKHFNPLLNLKSNSNSANSEFRKYLKSLRADR